MFCLYKKNSRSFCITLPAINPTPQRLPAIAPADRPCAADTCKHHCRPSPSSWQAKDPNIAIAGQTLILHQRHQTSSNSPSLLLLKLTILLHYILIMPISKILFWIWFWFKVIGSLAMCENTVGHSMCENPRIPPTFCYSSSFLIEIFHTLKFFNSMAASSS